MTTALDSTVGLDVLTGQPPFAEASERAIRTAASEGQLVCCECVLAEIAPAFGDHALARCRELLADWRLAFVPSSLESAVLAGEMFRLYRQRGQRARVFADFLIGAHARVHADRLLTRDRDYRKDYFGNLSVILVE